MFSRLFTNAPLQQQPPPQYQPQFYTYQNAFPTQQQNQTSQQQNDRYAALAELDSEIKQAKT